MSYKLVPLGELCEVLDNKRKPITKRDRIKGDFPYYGATGIVDYVGSFIFDEKLVLIGEDGAKWERGAKTAFLADGKYWVNNHAHVIKPLRNLILDEWIVFYLWQKDLKEFVSGMTVPKLNQAQLRSIPIPVPPVNIQQKIIRKLEDIFDEIDKASMVAQSNFKNVEKLFSAYLKDIFELNTNGWESVKVGDVIKLEYGKSLIQTDRDTNGTYIAYGANGAKSKTNKFLYDKPSIIVGRKGSAGELTIVNDSFWALDVTYYVTHDCKKTDLMYLYYALKTKNLPSLARGVKPGINRNDVYDLRIGLPSLMMQQKIITKLEAIFANVETAKACYSNKVKELDNLKLSILQQAFNGELVKD